MSKQNYPKMSRYEGKTLIELFEDLKLLFAHNNLTFKEIHLNTNVPEELLQIYFGNEKNVVSDLSKLFEFSKTRLRSHQMNFVVYRFFDNQSQIKIVRIIEPKAYMYYDRATQNYYRFSFKRRTLDTNTEANKEMIINEMDEHLQDYLKNKP
ncbi:MAG: hypothetical protein QM499_01235 [Flavobacteriaceae bacterium]